MKCPSKNLRGFKNDKQDINHSQQRDATSFGVLGVNVMASKNDFNWHQNYEALKAYIHERGHLPDKHVVENRALLSWAKYQRKKIKEGTLEDEKREMFESLLATRSKEHTGGRSSPNISRQHRSIYLVAWTDTNIKKY